MFVIGTNVALIIVVLIVLYLLYGVFCVHCDREISRDYYNLSVTLNDDNALNAVKSLSNIRNMRADDHYQLGRIIEHGGGDMNVAMNEYRTAIRELANENNTNEYIYPVGTMIDHIAHVRDRLNANGGANGANDRFEAYNIEDFTNVVPNDPIGTSTIDTAAMVERERKKRLAAANTPMATTEKYMAMSSGVESDPQNVHDHQVTVTYNKTLDKLGEPYLDADAAIDEIHAYITNNDKLSGSVATRAKRVLAMARENATISTYNSREGDILAAVWCRANDFRNSNNSQGIKDAIVDALADGVENGNPVCVGGRTARVLGSLAALDFDPDVSNAKTYSMYKQQIFDESYKIIQTTTQSAIDGNTALAESAKAYRGDTDGDTKPFVDHLKKTLTEHTNSYTMLSEADRGRISADVLAGIE